MIGQSVRNPFPVFFDTNGETLENGYIYIGETGLNPETSPVDTYWDVDVLYPAAQPIRTINGMPARAGTPGTIFIKGDDYSIKVENKKNILIYSNLSVTSASVVINDIFNEYLDPVDSIAELKLINTIPDTNPIVDGQVVLLTGYYADGDNGGGSFYWDSSSTETDNGGTIIKATGVTTGRWKRLYSGKITVKWFGAKGDDVTSDDTAFISASDISNVISVPESTGQYVVSSGVATGDTVFIFDAPDQLTGGATLNDVNGVVVSTRETPGGNFVDRLKAFTSVDSVYVRDDGSGNFAIGLHHNTDRVAEYKIGPDADDLYLLQGGFIGAETDATVVVPTLTGTFITTTSNSYTVTVNDTFDFTFRGTGFIFPHFADDRGGVWRFEVDGAIVAEISTFSSSLITTKIVEVVKGLPERDHSVVATFLGDDPLNPPSGGGGTSRGWFKYDYLAGGDITSATLISVEDLIYKSGQGRDILSQNSINDFAIHAIRDDDPASTRTWVPAHGAETGAARDITTEVYLDGVLVDSDPSISLPDPVTVEEVQVLNLYKAFNTLDVAGTYPLWIGYINLKVNKNGLEITHTIELQGDVDIDVGYVTMLASDSDHVDTALFNQGEKIKPLSAIDLNTTVRVLNNSGCFVDQGTGGNDIAVAVDCNLREVQRQGDERIIPKESIFLQQRASTIMKMYWKFAENEILDQANVYRVQNKYFICGGLRFPKAI
ncbi:hypothetical protein KAR91_01935 [Candidatus Pacearchaeota archaeon]|nr:hypothetical protein [Candidatus Pacearchaeota archaeon]